jgi:TRAP-type C4-dicarboxylate transport system permease small subunit
VTKPLVQNGLVWLQRIEIFLLAALVLTLAALAGAQIILRDFFDTGISWADQLMRSLVLWTGMLGALTAARDDKHIALDVLQRYLPPTAQRAARVVTLGFTVAVCAAMAYYCYRLIALEFAESTQAGAVSAIPAWLPVSILPIAFGLMAIRFALRAFAEPAYAPALLHDPGEARP